MVNDLHLVLELRQLTALKPTRCNVCATIVLVVHQENEEKLLYDAVIIQIIYILVFRTRNR